MTSDLIVSLARKYQNALLALGAEPIRGDTSKTAKDVTLAKRDNHLCWMCEQIIKVMQAGPTDNDLAKMNRWLAFIQARLYYNGTYTIDDLRAHNTETREIP